jgi:hypothetical protein
VESFPAFLVDIAKFAVPGAGGGGCPGMNEFQRILADRMSLDQEISASQFIAAAQRGCGSRPQVRRLSRETMKRPSIDIYETSTQSAG